MVSFCLFRCLCRSFGNLIMFGIGRWIYGWLVIIIMCLISWLSLVVSSFDGDFGSVMSVFIFFFIMEGLSLSFVKWWRDKLGMR